MSPGIVRLVDAEASNMECRQLRIYGGHEEPKKWFSSMRDGYNVHNSSRKSGIQAWEVYILVHNTLTEVMGGKIMAATYHNNPQSLSY